MGQYWDIFNFDRREKWAHPGGLKIGEFFWISGKGLAQLFTPPTCCNSACPFAGWSVTEKEYAEQTTPPENGPIVLRLPVELIDRIFDELEGLHTEIAFCLTHPRIGSICEDKVNDFFVKAFAPWVNTSVACVGDYADDDDFPPQIQRHLGQSGGTGLYDFVSATYTEAETIPWLRHQLEYIFTRTQPLTAAEWKKLDKLFAGVNTMKPPPKKETLLCNLTKGEYVRGDAVKVSLGTVLLSKICWSSDPSCAMRCDAGRLTRGPWAGDCFTIVQRTEMEEKSEWWERRVWQDVTEEAVAWIKELRDDSGR